jgi:CheY-like chemotaxis protein
VSEHNPARKEKTKSVLLVDDTPVNLHLLISVLQHTGLEVRPVLSGEMALRSARLMPPDLILLDIMLPGMSGYEVCQQLKADPMLKDIPVIFLSALGSESERRRAFDVGGAAYISKPFVVDEVRKIVTELLRIET